MKARNHFNISLTLNSSGRGQETNEALTKPYFPPSNCQNRPDLEIFLHIHTSFLQPSTGLQTFTFILEKLIIKQKLSANPKGGVAIQYFIPQEKIKYDYDRNMNHCIAVDKLKVEP